jgi:hypothetical protein
MSQYPQLQTKNINELVEAEYNPRVITGEALGRLAKSIAELGNLSPITWNARTGRVIGGHQRLRCYRAMGKSEVEVWAVDLPEAKEKVANIALNKLSGEFDMPKLKDIIIELDSGEMDMEISGFSMEEIQAMMETAPPENAGENQAPQVELPECSYTITFENEEQKAIWFKFLVMLKEKYPQEEGVSKRITNYISEIV